MAMQLVDLPKELFGGDAHKEGRTTVGNAEVAKGAGIAKYLDRRSLAMLACVNREFSEAAKIMKADLPQTPALHLVRLTPQMRALTAKSLFHNLGRGNEWEGSEAEKAMQGVKTEGDLADDAAEVMLVEAFAGDDADAIWEWEDHLPEHAAVICDVDATEKELFEALKTDTRTHPFWDAYAKDNKEDRWHQIPDPSYIHIMHCEALQIYPETIPWTWGDALAHHAADPEGDPFMEYEPPSRRLWAPGHPSAPGTSTTGSLWCGKIDVENAEVDGGWGVLTGPDNQWWGRGADAAGFWEVVRDAQNWD